MCNLLHLVAHSPRVVGLLALHHPIVRSTLPRAVLAAPLLVAVAVAGPSVVVEVVVAVQPAVAAMVAVPLVEEDKDVRIKDRLDFPEHPNPLGVPENLIYDTTF